MSIPSQLRKGQHGRYTPSCGCHQFSARIERLHRDGSITVKVLHLLAADGTEEPRLFGNNYRVDRAAFTLTEEA